MTTDDAGCTWADVDVTLSVGEERATECIARVAVPTDDDDNPWERAGDAWTPDAPGPLELPENERTERGSDVDRRAAKPCARPYAISAPSTRPPRS